MSYREEHPYGFYSIVVICLTVAVGIISYFGYQATIVNAEKEKEITAIHEKEETERTEERSQFWQKVIPWGSDEAEVNE